LIKKKYLFSIFKNKKITAFAGIGNPSNFFELLTENNLNVINTYSFPDHHNYSSDDFKKIIGDNSTKIVTTEKDYYRMNDDQKRNCDYVEVELEIDNKDKFKELIKSYL
jgi:tetraacyldisaccharide 4'-kinase